VKRSVIYHFIFRHRSGLGGWRNFLLQRGVHLDRGFLHKNSYLGLASFPSVAVCRPDSQQSAKLFSTEVTAGESESSRSNLWHRN
jgi:hypothetical protein